MRPDIDLAVLDIAGTTVDEKGAVYRSLEAAVRGAGAEPTGEQMARWFGADKTEAIRALVPAADPAPVYADFRSRLAAAYEADPPVPVPGAADALAALRAAGVRVVLSTGFSREVTDSLLASIGWSVGRTLDGVVCAEEVGAGRPAPYMVFEAMRRTGTHDVRRVLVAGDTVRDLEAGTNAGAGFVVGVLTGAMTRAQLSRSASTHLLDSVADVVPLVVRP